MALQEVPIALLAGARLIFNPLKQNWQIWGFLDREIIELHIGRSCFPTTIGAGKRSGVNCILLKTNLEQLGK